jgi:hypothetical protein
MKNILLITAFIFVLISCNNRRDNLNNNPPDNINKIKVEKHKSTILGKLLEQELKEFSTVGNTSVIDSVNGFKSLHFDMSIDDLDVSTQESASLKGAFPFINNDNYSQVNTPIVQNINGELASVIRLADAPVYFITLEFYKKKLARITVTFKDYIKKGNSNPTKDKEFFDFQSYGLVNLCINSFGKPNIYSCVGKQILLENAIEDLNEDCSLCCDPSFQWQTNRTFYELNLENLRKNSLVEYEERKDYFIINTKIVTYLKGIKDSLDYFKEHYERQYNRNQFKTDSIKDVKQKKRAMSDL